MKEQKHGVWAGISEPFPFSFLSPLPCKPTRQAILLPLTVSSKACCPLLTLGYSLEFEPIMLKLILLRQVNGMFCYTLLLKYNDYNILLIMQESLLIPCHFSLAFQQPEGMKERRERERLHLRKSKSHKRMGEKSEPGREQKEDECSEDVAAKYNEQFPSQVNIEK